MKPNLKVIGSVIAGLSIWGFLMGCTPGNDAQLPSGTYRASEGNQNIVVQDKGIFFHILLDDAKTNYFDRSYERHSIWPNGRIQAFPMRETDAVLGIGKYWWIWDGTNIFKQNPQSGRSTLFSPDK